MQDRNQIEAEIRATKMQLGIAEMAIETAPEAEKDKWRSKQTTLLQRLEELEKTLAALPDEPPVSPVVNDADADALLNEILSASEPAAAEPVVPTPPVTDTDMDALLNEILSAEEPAAGEPTAQTPPVNDADVDALLNEILSASDPVAQEPVVPTPQANDADMDALLNEILFAETPAAGEPAAQTVPVDDADVDALLKEILSADEPAPQQEPEKATSVGASDAMLGEIFAAQQAPQLITGEEEANEPIKAEEPIQAEAPVRNAESAPIFEAPVHSEQAEPAAEAPASEPTRGESPQTERSPLFAAVDDIRQAQESDRPVAATVDAVLGAIFGAPQAQPQEAQALQAQPQAQPVQQSPAQRPTEQSVHRSAQQPQEPLDFDARLAMLRGTVADEGDALDNLAALKAEADDLLKRAKQLLKEAEEMKEEAAQIKLAAEMEHAMYAAEDELQRGLRHEEALKRDKNDHEVKEKLAEKIARRKAEISSIRNGIQNVKDPESAFVLREQLFSIQVVLDEDERNSPEITYLLTKTQDDVNHALETAELRRRLAGAEAKPPVRKKKAAPKKAAKPKKKKAAAKKRPAARSARPSRSSSRPRPPMRHRSSPPMRPYR